MILITGGLGYVGSTLCRNLLACGYKVLCTDNFYKNDAESVFELFQNPNFQFEEFDVTDKQKFQYILDNYPINGIIHLAGVVGFPNCARYPGLAKSTNIDGTKTVVEGKGKIPLVFASTGSVYGKVEGICTEDSPLNTTTLYGLTKAEGEHIVLNAPNTMVFRFATAFGVSPNMRVKLLVNEFVHDAIHRRSLNIFEADARRTFISVKDMSRALIWGLEGLSRQHTLSHKIYNCGDNNLNWTKRELAEYIKTKVDCAVTYNEVGKDLDNRDYEVSYDRLNDDGFYCKYKMEDCINELIKCVKVMHINHRYI